MAILFIFSFTLVGLAEGIAVAIEANGPLESVVTGKGFADDGTVLSTGAGISAWLHPVNIKVADIAAPTHMGILRCLLRPLIIHPLELVRHELPDEAMNLPDSI